MNSFTTEFTWQHELNFLQSVLEHSVTLISSSCTLHLMFAAKTMYALHKSPCKQGLIMYTDQLHTQLNSA